MTSPAVNTPYYIVGEGLREAKILAKGQTPDSEQLAKGMTRLNQMVNIWQTQGLKLWLQSDQSVTLVAGQGGQGNPYTLMPSGDVNITKPLRALQGYYLDSSAVRRPIYPLSRQEWMTLSTTTQQGQVSQYFIDKLQDRLAVYFWLVPDATAATGTAHLLLQTQVTNTISLTDTMAFPVEWTLALIWGLADESSSGQPAQIVQQCQQKALYYKTLLEDWDVEDATTQFQPDSRGGNVGTQNFV